MRLSVEAARALAAQAVTLTDADQAEAVVVTDTSALTRFANNHIHQNVVEENARVSIRAVLGTQIGVASTNRLDDESLATCAAQAVATARNTPADDGFPGLPAPVDIEEQERGRDTTATFDAEARAQAVRSIIEQSSVRGLTAAGKVSAADNVVGIANSLGVDAAMSVSEVRATVLSMGPGNGSGWASYTGPDATALAAAALGDEAATLAERSADPREFEPGDYTVVLAPEAVTELLAMLAYTGFSAKAVEEGSSFMAGHEGEKLMADSITIVDDALRTGGLGLTFDWEGQPKRITPLVENGVVMSPVTDSYWAARTGRENTGHALPAPNSFGPLSLDMAIAAGDTRVDDMIAGVERGVYVTRFHYTNVEDPVKAVLTGMTRDGTFLIEDGRLTAPLKNLRFTQSAVEALANVEAVGERRELVGEMLGASLVPALLIREFGITGQTG